MIIEKKIFTVRLRSVILLVALLALILHVPFAATQNSPNIVRLFYTVLFCFAGYLLSMQKKWVVCYLSIALPALIVSIICTTYPDYGRLDVIRDMLTLTLQILLIAVVLKFSLLNSEANELDRVIAGVCGYLILGLLWSDVYVIVEHLAPGSILHSSGESVSNGDGSLIYFSIVTLTTLGYGDITPATPLTRIIAALEAAAGTLYLAVLIASLMAGLRKPDSDSKAP